MCKDNNKEANLSNLDMTLNIYRKMNGQQSQSFVLKGLYHVVSMDKRSVYNISRQTAECCHFCSVVVFIHQ